MEAHIGRRTDYGGDAARGPLAWASDIMSVREKFLMFACGCACLLITWITEAPMGYIIMVVARIAEPHAQEAGRQDKTQDDIYCRWCR